MTIPVEKIKFAAGQTFEHTSVWCATPYTFKTIASITRGWPTLMTVTAHGIPDGIVLGAWIANVEGPTALNTTPEAPLAVKRVDANTIEVINFNTGAADAYVAGTGTLAFAPPVDMTGFIVRTQFRASAASAVLLSLTSESPAPTDWATGFVLTEATAKVVMTITPAQGRTLLAGAPKGIAQVEFVSPAGKVYRPRDFKWQVTSEGTVEA